ncbi:MAG: hypothetical protein ABL934_09880 [Lysobacteraceae bacterium]
MTQIIKDKHGKVVSTTDTEYHRDGTGARDKEGVPISDVVTEPQPEGFSEESAAALKAALYGPTSTTVASSSAANKPER